MRQVNYCKGLSVNYVYFIRLFNQKDWTLLRHQSKVPIAGNNMKT